MEQLGLTQSEADLRLEKYGSNDVEEQKVSFFKTYITPLFSPISLMLLGAAVLSRIDGRIFDFYFILFLYVVNYSIQKWQEFKADKAIKELRDKLSFDVHVLRDGKWGFVNAKKLVPGDRIRLGLGSIIPADGTVVASKNLSVNEAVLTGESMPKDKKTGDKIFSGAFIATGSLEADVTATGKNTSFGKTIFSIEKSTEKSILEKDILRITRFLTIAAVFAVLLLSTVLLLRGYAWSDLLTLDLSLVIAGIPVALPAVMAIILSIGAAGLAKKLVVVRRLSALQDLANVNMVLSDKTGTLTKNEISVMNVLSYRHALQGEDVLRLAKYATAAETPDAIDTAIIKKLEEMHAPADEGRVTDFIPYDSDRKRTTAMVEEQGKRFVVSMGASQVIQGLGGFDTPEMEKSFEEDIARAAQGGFRVLAVAVREGDIKEEGMSVIGLIFLADPLDETSKETIQFMRENGIGVKMVTGDNKVIAERIANELDMPGRVLSEKETKAFYQDPKAVKEQAADIAVFAEILPKDKYELVRAFRDDGYVVASTGDGINDLPALKTANVGIAVAGAVSALKSLADIVLLGRGISVIKDAIIESRKIFVRLYNYSVYRISESFRLIVTILILGIAYGFYPLEPLQIILLAFLNDLPIISLAFDRVKISPKPSSIQPARRLGLSVMYGVVGTMNSLVMFFVIMNVLHMPLGVVQTMFFLKLMVSGHMLIFVAHTKERWWRFLPSHQVIIATLTTQVVATALAVTGFMMPAPISLGAASFVWIWSLAWMQLTEFSKDVQEWWLRRHGLPV
ncbi:plasma-membrane proton-efflux P-type ATPase [Patescibacteria group bacterium]|nr:plasma-membrane proton-efflux P-type ATPase [Patescibacteria group bacterium]